MANNLIQIKRSTSTAIPSSLAAGELAYSSESTSNSLFIGAPAGGGIYRIAGGKYSFLHQAGNPGVLTSNAVIITDVNSFVTNTYTQGLVITPSSGSGPSGNDAFVNSISKFSNTSYLGSSSTGSNNELVTSWAIKNYVDGVAIAATTPAGSNQQFQYNDSGTIAGTSNFKYNKDTGIVTVGNSSSYVVTGYISDLSATLESFADQNNYVQISHQNHNSGSSASTDFAAYNDDDSYATFIDMGINSSGWSNTLWTINGANDGYLYTSGGNLAIGTNTATKEIVFFTGGTLANKERFRIKDDGVVIKKGIYANGSLGTSSQILASNSSGGVYWMSVGAIGTNTDAQYTWSNTITFSNTVTFDQTINGTANNATNFDGDSSTTWASWITGNAATAYTNATSYADFAAANAYSNAVSDVEYWVGQQGYLTSTDLSSYATQTYADQAAGNAYSNATSYADYAAGNAYSNATSYADFAAANAYSNAVSDVEYWVGQQGYLTSTDLSSYATQTYADNAAGNAYSNATSYADYAAANAYSNATSYADYAAANAYSNAMSDTLSRDGTYTGNNIFSGANTNISGFLTTANADLASIKLRTSSFIGGSYDRNEINLNAGEHLQLSGGNYGVDIRASNNGTNWFTLSLSGDDGSFVPSANGTMNLGSLEKRFGTLYLAGSTIVLGNTTLSANDSALQTNNLVVTSNATIANIVGTTTGVSSNLVITSANVDMASAYVRVRDIDISGNLTVSGTLTTIDTNNISVKDTNIKLADGNISSDTIDFGFYGLYNSGSTQYYSGLFRDHSISGATNPVFHLFTTTTEPTSIVDTTAGGYHLGTLAAYLNSGAFVANSSVVNITANSTVSSTITANSMTLSTALAATSGGTGQSSYSTGDLLYASSGTALSKLSVPGSAANGQVLMITNNLPAYGTLDGGTF
jgi:hypothetical protein